MAACESEEPLHRPSLLTQARPVRSSGFTSVSAAYLLCRRPWASGAPFSSALARRFPVCFCESVRVPLLLLAAGRASAQCDTAASHDFFHKISDLY